MGGKRGSPVLGRPHRVLLAYILSRRETEVAGGKHAVVYSVIWAAIQNTPAQIYFPFV